jgi:SIR2-like domain
MPAKMPSTKELTEAVLESDDNHAEGCHSFSISSFLRLLRERVKDHFQEINRPSNYEDLYYICSQLTDHNFGNFENPVVIPFVQDLLAHLRSADTDATEENVYGLAMEALAHISKVVSKELRRTPTTLSHLSFIYDAFASPRYRTMDIFTLNHDCLVETYLRLKGVDLVDGFGEAKEQVRYWDPLVFQNKKSKVNLFKLHGSVDWCRLRKWGQGPEGDAIGILLDGADPSRLQVDVMDDNRPKMLIGTFNKMLDYTQGIFLDLLWQFRYRLRVTTHVVICGYGFGDKGINTQLAEWMYGDVANKICVIHPHRSSLINSARPAIKNPWDDWERDRRLVVVPKGAEFVTFDEIREALACETAN